MPFLDIKGLDLGRVKVKLQVVPAESTATALKATYEWAEEVMTDAKAITPVRTGVLRSSGRVRYKTAGKTWFEVSLEFGGQASAYALIVHENLAVRHKSPGQAKFLEQPFQEKLPELRDRVEKAITDYLSTVQ